MEITEETVIQPRTDKMGYTLPDQFKPGARVRDIDNDERRHYGVVDFVGQDVDGCWCFAFSDRYSWFGQKVNYCKDFELYQPEQ